jgi:hypothetical protein
LFLRFSSSILCLPHLFFILSSCVPLPPSHRGRRFRSTLSML